MADQAATFSARQAPWRQVANPFPPLAPLSADELAFVQDRSLRVLEEIGVECLHDGALAILAAAGAEVDRAARRVRFDRALVAEAVARAPSGFRLHARNPARDVTIGGNRIAFCPVASPPFAFAAGSAFLRAIAMPYPAPPRSASRASTS